MRRSLAFVEAVSLMNCSVITEIDAPISSSGVRMRVPARDDVAEYPVTAPALTTKGDSSTVSSSGLEVAL
jgi:hypothetical protein